MTPSLPSTQKTDFQKIDSMIRIFNDSMFLNIQWFEYSMIQWFNVFKYSIIQWFNDSMFSNIRLFNDSMIQWSEYSMYSNIQWFNVFEYSMIQWFNIESLNIRKCSIQWSNIQYPYLSVKINVLGVWMPNISAGVLTYKFYTVFTTLPQVIHACI